jgi:DNA-nicking Smr family endonuclease
MKGNECEFGHSQAAINVFQKSLPAPSPEPLKKAIIIEEDFPALGAVTAPQGPFTKNFSKVVSSGGQKKQVLQTTQKAHPLSHLETKTKKGIKWVDTGASTSHQYMQHREEAARLCIQRNVLFEQATFAYQTGNKLSAKNLAFQAHTLNEEIAKLHETAASTIYQSRNNYSHTNVAKEVVIDLHGLHSEEAVSCVERKVEELRKKGYQGDLNIITGTGNHSKFKAKVLPAVLAWVKQSGNRYQQGSMEDGRGGIIVVNL